MCPWAPRLMGMIWFNKNKVHWSFNPELPLFLVEERSKLIEYSKQAFYFLVLLAKALKSMWAKARFLKPSEALFNWVDFWSKNALLFLSCGWLTLRWDCVHRNLSVSRELPSVKFHHIERLACFWEKARAAEHLPGATGSLGERQTGHAAKIALSANFQMDCFSSALLFKICSERAPRAGKGCWARLFFLVAMELLVSITEHQSHWARKVSARTHWLFGEAEE